MCQDKLPWILKGKILIRNKWWWTAIRTYGIVTFYENMLVYDNNIAGVQQYNNNSSLNHGLKMVSYLNDLHKVGDLIFSLENNMPK